MTTTERAPVRIGNAFGSAWFHQVDGRELTRMATCSRCNGPPFEQRQLSARFMEICEKQGAGAVRAVMDTIPDLWVPVFCPPCEHRDLERRGESVTSFAMPIPRRLRDKERFAENMSRLFGAWNRPQDDATARAYWLALDRTMSDDDFENAVLSAIRTDSKWPVASRLAQIANPLPR